MSAAKRDAALKLIARRHLALETLESLQSDSLDFKEQSVWAIRAALEAAYEAGREEAQVPWMDPQRVEIPGGKR